MISQRLTLDAVTIGVITVLAEEFSAAFTVLGCKEQVSVGGRIYKIGQIPRRDGDGSHTIAVTRLLDMGTNAAATRTALLVRDCPNVQDVLMCGIAAAIPNPRKPTAHVRVGDIVVSDGAGILQYDFERVTEAGTAIQPRWFRPSNRIREVARMLQAEEQANLRPWDTYIARSIEQLDTGEIENRWARPADKSDILREYDPTRTLDNLVRWSRRWKPIAKLARYRAISHPHDPERIGGVPKVFHGVIACANKLQKNSVQRDVLRDTYRALALEMEGSGVAEAADNLDTVRFFVIRGTCDYANAEKNDLWHHYAALIAAAYTRALIEAAPLPELLSSPSQLITKATQTNLSTVSSAAIDVPSSSQITVDFLQDAARLDSKVTDLLEDKCQQYVALINAALEEWEFKKAAKIAADLEDFMLKQDSHLSEQTRASAYESLARNEIAAANRNRSDTGKLERADMFLGKAKQAHQGRGIQ